MNVYPQTWLSPSGPTPQPLFIPLAPCTHCKPPCSDRHGLPQQCCHMHLLPFLAVSMLWGVASILWSPCNDRKSGVHLSMATKSQLLSGHQEIETFQPITDRVASCQVHLLKAQPDLGPGPSCSCRISAEPQQSIPDKAPMPS